MESSWNPSIPTPNSSAIYPQSIRQNIDPIWTHFIMAQSSDENKLLIYNFCRKVIKGEVLLGRKCI